MTKIVILKNFLFLLFWSKKINFITTNYFSQQNTTKPRERVFHVDKYVLRDPSINATVHIAPFFFFFLGQPQLPLTPHTVFD